MITLDWVLGRLCRPHGTGSIQAGSSPCTLTVSQYTAFLDSIIRISFVFQNLNEYKNYSLLKKGQIRIWIISIQIIFEYRNFCLIHALAICIVYAKHLLVSDWYLLSWGLSSNLDCFHLAYTPGDHSDESTVAILHRHQGAATVTLAITRSVE